MLLPGAIKKKKTPSIKLPAFSFETHTMDLQEIDEGDPLRDAKKAESLVEDFIRMQRERLEKKGQVLAVFFPNLHPIIKVCFVTLVIISRDGMKIQLKEKEKPFVGEI